MSVIHMHVSTSAGWHGMSACNVGTCCSIVRYGSTSITVDAHVSHVTSLYMRQIQYALDRLMACSYWAMIGWIECQTI